MTVRKRTAASARLAIVTTATAEAIDPLDVAITTDVVKAWELGRQAGLDAKAEGFVEGMRLGIALISRLAAGDVRLARELAAVLDR